MKSTVYPSRRISKMASAFGLLAVIVLLLTLGERTSSSSPENTNEHVENTAETNAVLHSMHCQQGTFVREGYGKGSGAAGRRDNNKQVLGAGAAGRRDNNKQVLGAGAEPSNELGSYQHNLNVSAVDDDVISALRLRRRKEDVADIERYFGSRHGSDEIKSQKNAGKLFVERSTADDEGSGITANISESSGVLNNSSNMIISKYETPDSEISERKQKDSVELNTETRHNDQFSFKISSRNNSSSSTEIPGDLSPRSKTSQMMTSGTNVNDDLGCRFGMNERRLLSIAGHEYDRITCFWCYVFVPKHRKKEALKLDFKNHHFLYNNNSFAFDHYNATVWGIVQESMIDDLETSKLEGCCKEAIQCCDAMLQEAPSPAPTGSCPATWDGWTCVSQPVPAFHSVTVKCPVHAYTGYPECYMTGKKWCGDGGIWQLNKAYEFTNYTGCSMEDFHQLNYIWEAIMHGISLAALLPALLVLCCYRALRLPRFQMHVNFFIALFLRGLFKILELTIIKIPENLNTSNILEDNGIGCKVMVTMSKVALLSVWAWMMVESIFLHRLISRPFSRVTTILPYVAGAWGGAVVIGVAWALCRALLEDFQCWLGDRKGDALQLHLVTDIPILISLLINIGLLIDMGRIMYLQLRGRNSDQSDVNKRAVKGTLFLVPMFGAQFLLTAVAPIGVQCSWLQGYMMVSTAMTGLQGFYITIFYCYNNKEVQKQLRLSSMRLQHQLCPSMLESTGLSDRRWGDTSAADPQTTMSTVMSEDSTPRGGGTAVEMQPLRG